MMDRALKERIIGAVVLVVFAVLIVPVFLDGQSNDVQRVQETIALPGQQADGAKQKTIVLERDRTEPVPTARHQVQQLNLPTPAVEKKPRPKPVAEPKVAANTSKIPEKESSSGMWAVQIGSFSNQANAKRLAADLRKKGFAAFLSQLKTSKGNLHRVRVGPQKDRASAESVAARLSEQGQKGQVVPHP